jgi:hypothetical protein
MIRVNVDGVQLALSVWIVSMADRDEADHLSFHLGNERWIAAVHLRSALHR